jgi:acid phosphatase type 7
MRLTFVLLAALCCAVGAAASPFVHGPYSGAPSEASVTISWLSSDPHPAYVEYERLSVHASSGTFSLSSEIQSAETDTANKIHVRLGGLDPDTDYVYRVVLDTPDGRVESPHGRFATAPPSGERISFAVLADTQWQWEGDNRLQAVADAIAADETAFDFILHAGDVVESPSATYWDHWFASFSNVLLRAPFLPVLGNHERNHGSYYDHFALPPGGGRRDERWWALHWGDVVVVGLDTNVSQAADYLAQQAWAREHLSGPEPHKFVMFHHPVYSSDAYHGSGYSYDVIFHPIFVETNVDIVFNGHAHNYERIVRDGVTYLVLGGGGAVPRALAAERVEGSVVAQEGYNFYLRVTTSPDSIVVETVSVARAGEAEFDLTDGHLLDSFALADEESVRVHARQLVVWLLLIGAAAVAGLLLLRHR